MNNNFEFEKQIITMKIMKDIILNCLPNMLLTTFNDCFAKNKYLEHPGSSKANNSDFPITVVKWGYFVDPENCQYQLSSQRRTKRTFHEHQNHRQIKSESTRKSSKKVSREAKKSVRTPVINETKEVNYYLPHNDSITRNRRSYQNLFYYADDNNLN